jgi:tRNA-splicing ligase RtcB
MPILAELNKGAVPIKIWAPIHEVESQALDQLINISNLPGVFHHVAAMPDVHLGTGATVGSVIATKDIVAPAAVGVDIGCGMAAVKTNLKSTDFGDGQLAALRASIERGVPVGNGPAGGHREVTNAANKWSRDAVGFYANLPVIERVHLQQLGSLGGGNHFIEVCVDTADNVWIMLHSGSRRFGKDIADVHMKKARLICEQAHVHLTDKNLSFLTRGTPEFDAYVSDVELAQDYAKENRKLMLIEVIKDIRHMWPQLVIGEIINCHHNYLSQEMHFGENVLVTRKGAIRAGKGELGIIPGSMGTRSYIVRGLGNPESFESCSHGAGRRMSRTAAKKAFTVEDLIEQTKGVECRKDAGVIDEIPGSYKNIDEVMAAQTDLVEVVAQIKQVLCVKG